MTVWTIPTQHSSFLCLTSGDANAEADASFDPTRQAAFRQRRAPPAAQFEKSRLIPAENPERLLRWRRKCTGKHCWQEKMLLTTSFLRGSAATSRLPVGFPHFLMMRGSSVSFSLLLRLYLCLGAGYLHHLFSFAVMHWLSQMQQNDS